MKTKHKKGAPLALNKLLLLSIITFCCSKSNSTFSLPEEADALLQWKSSLQNPNNSFLSSWTTTFMPILPCTWFGVSCTRDGSINRLNLSSSSLQGTLYQFSFSSFPNLTHFELSANTLFGTIPSEISYLSKLVYLDFSNNQFSGIIPQEICLLTNLEVLHLFNNQLNGSISQEIGNLTHLSDLALYNNNLQGTLPSSLGNLTSLSYLYLYNNSISGPIPLELGSLSSLEELLLSQNFLTGSIPSTLGNLSKLTFLHLPENQLSGSIPAEIGKLTLLQSLVLSMNNLFGFIPTSLGNLTSLSFLYLHTNNLSGPIPEELGKLKSLTDLELDQNQLNGSIPASFGNLTNLEFLYLRDNNLSGSIPQELGNLMNVVEFGLDTNKFIGYLPENICRSGKLQFLTVNNNELTGPIPPSLRNCSRLVRARFERNQLSGNISEIFSVYPHLIYMNLNDNKLYGEISVWTKCQNLSTLQIARNNITGNIPVEFGTSTQLRILDLSSNQLEGEIPKEFEQLNHLLKLDLSDNLLSGALPKEIITLTDLSYLDLSRNKLNGSIPENAEVHHWQSLTHLNLSNNNFSNEIPVWVRTLNRLSSLDLSYNSLTGGIPSELPKLASLEMLNLSHNKLFGFVPKSFDNMSSLSDIDISYNELWGPIPNSEAFMQASRAALQGNKDLCGGNTTTNGLKSCEINSSTVKKNKKSHKRILIIVAVVLSLVGVISLVGTFTWLFIIHKRRKQNPKVENVECELNKNVFSASNFDGSAMYEEILKATNEFDADNCIGKGGFSTVYKAKLELHNIVVAVKKLHTSSSDEMEGRNDGFVNEVRAQTEVRHKNIVKLYGYCSHPRHSFLIFEYMERGNLAMILSKDEDAKKLDWLQRINIVKGIAHALSYLHHDSSPSIVHRDISSKNILLKSDYEACLSDFGVAKLLNQRSTNWSAVAGTIGYIAPELAYTTRVTEKCDVYSFGVLALEVIKGTHPANSITSVSSSSAENIVLNNLLDERLPPPALEVEEAIKSMLFLTIPCLNSNPETRPTMYTVSQLLSTRHL